MWPQVVLVFHRICSEGSHHPNPHLHLHVFLIFVVCGCVFIAAEVLRVRLEIEARVVLLKQDVFAGDSFAEMREGTPVAYSFLFAAINVSLIIAGC